MFILIPFRPITHVEMRLAEIERQKIVEHLKADKIQKLERELESISAQLEELKAQ